MSTQNVYVFPDIRRVEKEEIQQNIFKLEFHGSYIETNQNTCLPN